MSDATRFVPLIPTLDGSATETGSTTLGYFVAPRAMFLRELYSLVRGAIDFTTGNESGQVVVDYSTTVGGSYTTVYTETAALANTWTAGTPKAHTVSAAQQVVRIPQGAVVRVRFIGSGTTPSFANVHVFPAFETV